MKRLLAVAIAAAALASCATPTGPQPRQPVTYAQITQRALLTAETAFNVAASAELDAKAVGLLKGEKAAKADAVRRNAYEALVAIRAVVRAGAQPDLSTLLQLTNQLLVLAGKQPAAIPPTPALPSSTGGAQ